MFRLADELRQPAQQFDLAVIQAARALLDGRFAEAEELIPQASRTGERSMPREATVACRLQLFILRREQGRLSEFEPIVERSIDEYPDWPFRSLHANLLAELGREAEARRVFENSAASEFGRLPRDESWLFGMSFLPEVARFLADPARAESLYELLLPCDGQYIQTGEEAGCGAVSRYLGILASTQKNWTDATRHFEDALEQNEGMGARLWIVRTQYDYGRCSVNAIGQATGRRRWSS